MLGLLFPFHLRHPPQQVEVDFLSRMIPPPGPPPQSPMHFFQDALYKSLDLSFISPFIPFVRPPPFFHLPPLLSPTRCDSPVFGPPFMPSFPPIPPPPFVSALTRTFWFLFPSCILLFKGFHDMAPGGFGNSVCSPVQLLGWCFSSHHLPESPVVVMSSTVRIPFPKSSIFFTDRLLTVHERILESPLFVRQSFQDYGEPAIPPISYFFASSASTF